MTNSFLLNPEAEKEIKQVLKAGYNCNSNWYMYDKILYEMCKEYPEHKDKHIIVAKIGLIGRAYSAAVERRKNVESTKGDFYYGYVAPIIKNSNLDDRLSELRCFKFPTEDNMDKILSTHKYMQDLLKECTAMEKRSLVSKYLHFHLPNLFYLFDSYSEYQLNKIVKCSKWICPPDADYSYAKYYEKSLFIQARISPNSPNFPRILDSYLQLKSRE